MAETAMIDRTVLVRLVPPRPKQPAPLMRAVPALLETEWCRDLTAEAWRLYMVLLSECPNVREGADPDSAWPWPDLVRRSGFKSEIGLKKALAELVLCGLVKMGFRHACGLMVDEGQERCACGALAIQDLTGCLGLRMPASVPVRFAGDPEPKEMSPSAVAPKPQAKNNPASRAPGIPVEIRDVIRDLARGAGVTEQGPAFWRNWTQAWKGMWARLEGTRWSESREPSILAAITAFYNAYFNMDSPRTMVAQIVPALSGTLKPWRADGRALYRPRTERRYDDDFERLAAEAPESVRNTGLF